MAGEVRRHRERKRKTRATQSPTQSVTAETKLTPDPNAEHLDLETHAEQRNATVKFHGDKLSEAFHH